MGWFNSENDISSAPGIDVFTVDLSSTDYTGNLRRLDVVTTGDVKIVTAAGITRTLSSLPAGYQITCGITKVFKTGTTSTQLIGYV